MTPFQNIKNFFQRGGQTINFVGAPSFRTWNPGGMFNHYHSDAYASAYPSIRAISNEYMAVSPYAVNAKGEKVPSPVIDALHHPNQMDSSVSFRERMAVSTLSLKNTYVLVWRREGGEAKPGGDFKRDQIAGFTFLEFPAITRRDMKTFYTIGSQEFSEMEVIQLPGGVDPYNLYAGYSPSEASRRWSKLDDYIADFQAGFFENNAIPAGQFIVTAPTDKEYNNIVDMLESRHKGAGSNNNVTYSHRPVDKATGKPAAAQIEWIPFGQANKDIDFKNLFDQVNKRIDTAFGVPAIVKGIDDAATYANAQVAEKTFAKRAVYPLLLRNYTQFTHELNRITDGLGVAITFKYDIPTVADEEKVEAETNKIRVETINLLTTAGYSLDSIVEALELPNGFKKLELGADTGTAKEDNPDVDEGGEVDDSPNPDKIDGVTPVNKGEANGKGPKAAATYEKQLEKAARNYLRSQVDSAIAAFRQEEALTNQVKNEVDPNQTQEQQDTFVDEALAVIVAIMGVNGVIKYADGIDLLESADESTSTLTGFSLSDDAKDAYESYLGRVAQSYGNDTAASIQKVLALSNAEGWTRTQTEDALRGIMNTDEYRVKRLAVTELNRSGSLGGVEAMKQIQAESGVTLEKALVHTGGDAPCEFCASIIGRWVAVDQPILSVGESIIGVDGGIMVNNFVANEGYDPHPNGHCTNEYRVVRS